MGGELLDLALLFGLVALTLYILSVTGVLALGNLAYIFLCIFIVLLVLWLVVRIFGFGRSRTWSGRRRGLV